MTTFDECFQTFPQINAPDDLDQFWKESQKELKSVAIREELHAPLKGRHVKDTVYNVSFQSALNYKIKGTLVIPRKRGDLPVLVYFHDYYASRPKYIDGLTDLGIAHLIIDLRGHGSELVKPVFPPEKKKEEEAWTPGYFLEGIEDKDSFYLKYLYLDVIRCIDFLRLTKGIDSEKIYLHGKNLGASMALFGAAYSNRVKALILETPNFCYVTEEQLKSASAWSREIASYSRDLTPARKTKLKKNIAYFDSLNFVKKINMPVMVSCGLKDKISNPKSVFSVINHLKGDKQIHVYPENGNEAGSKDMHAKIIAFLGEITG